MPAHLADERLEQDVEDATENALISSEKMVLMQTAIGNILNPTNGMQERTYITEKLAKKLNLNWRKRAKFPWSLSDLRSHSHWIHIQLF